MTEEITSALSRLSGLFVIARTSAFFYKGKQVKVRDISREMGVRYMLEGSVLKADGQIRVTTQLIDATTGYHLWSERYDRPLTDIFALQDGIVQKIVTTLKLQLTLQEQGWVVRKRTDNLEAYDTFLRGLEHFWRFTKEGTAQARPLLEKAIALAPNNADGYATLVNIFNIFEQRPSEAVALLEQAMRLNPRPQFWYAHQLGWSYRLVGRYEEALAAAKQAVLRNPDWLGSHLELSLNYLLLWSSQQSHDPQTLDQALEAAQRAVALDAASPWTHLLLSLAYLWEKHYDQALAETEQVLALNPPFAGFYTVSAGILTYLGQLEKAKSDHIRLVHFLTSSCFSSRSA
jgi:adenylate cyclase